MRVLPATLPGRVILVLSLILISAQFLSSLLLLRDRGQILFHSVQESFLLRSAGMVRILDSVSVQDRNVLLPVFNTQESRIRVLPKPLPTTAMEPEQQKISRRVEERLTQLLPRYRDIRVELERFERPLARPPMKPGSGAMWRQHQEMMGRPGRGPPPWGFMHGAASSIRMIRIQLPLKNGPWLLIERRLPEQIYNWPDQLLLTLAIVLLAAIAVAYILVRWVVRPLRNLRLASERLGKDINSDPVPIDGPLEVAQTAQAFNTMQQRLQRYIEDRSRILAAVSHDLKTPLTRLRLRTDLLEDSHIRDKLQRDLDDMEAMVLATLDFMRGTDSQEMTQEIDLGAMLESLQSDAEEQGAQITLDNHINKPFKGRPVALRRCLGNLIDNAIKYGHVVDLYAAQGDDEVVINIDDQGPGIPDNELERVFDPFYRMESSRSRDTGGAGLGLGIARNIARAHGGEIQLYNRQDGGLRATLRLPR